MIKTQQWIALTVVVWLVGCGGGGESPATSQPEVRRSEAPAPAPESAKSTVQTVRDQAQKAVAAVDEAAEKAKALAAEATAKAQGMLDQTRSLISQKKVQEAGALLGQLAGMALNDDQQKTLGGLQTELKQLGADVTKGLTDLNTFVTEKKYSEATVLVSKLAEFQLSPEQRKLYDDLKGQLQQLAATQAGQEAQKAIGNLLPNRPK